MLFSLLTALFACVIVVITGEFLLRVFSPQTSMYPRWKFSPEYGYVLYGNTTMVHERPGRWRFTYTTNEYQYRGKSIPISNRYDKPNIVILGDSYSFGAGVNDGDEYAAIMNEELEEHFNVVNLGVGGWGLAQEIRRYYEFGQLYSPRVVVLQFATNDPTDNFNNRVTTVEDGKFRFRNSNSTINWLKKYLSHSIIQNSQLYNLFRDTLYRYFKANIIEREKLTFGEAYSGESPPEETFYNDLLEMFADDLNKKGVSLLMIAVNGQLDRFPYIKEKVNNLDRRGVLQYYEVKEWFKDITNYGSPEGHAWGKKAHHIVGAKLAQIIKRNHTSMNEK